LHTCSYMLCVAWKPYIHVREHFRSRPSTRNGQWATPKSRSSCRRRRRSRDRLKRRSSARQGCRSGDRPRIVFTKLHFGRKLFG
jgi:hypothetical protein